VADGEGGKQRFTFSNPCSFLILILNDDNGSNGSEVFDKEDDKLLEENSGNNGEQHRLGIEDNNTHEQTEEDRALQLSAAKDRQ